MLPDSRPRASPLAKHGATVRRADWSLGGIGLHDAPAASPWPRVPAAGEPHGPCVPCCCEEVPALRSETSMPQACKEALPESCQASKRASGMSQNGPCPTELVTRGLSPTARRAEERTPCLQHGIPFCAPTRREPCQRRPGTSWSRQEASGMRRGTASPFSPRRSDRCRFWTAAR